MALGELWAAFKAAVGIGEVAYKGWGWFRKWWYGTIDITHPQNRAVVQAPRIDLEGTHNNPKGHFWLFDARGSDYWPKLRISLHPDGHWKESFSIGDRSTPSTAIILLVRVSDFMHAILEDSMDRSKRAQYWRPITMIPPKNHFSVVQSIVLNVQPNRTS